MRQKYEGKEPRLFGAESGEEVALAKENLFVDIVTWMFTWKDKNAEKLNELEREHEYTLRQPTIDTAITGQSNFSHRN